jgi:adenine-specific DNA-methyltransferase
MVIIEKMTNTLYTNPKTVNQNPISFLEEMDYLRTNALNSLNKEHQTEFGQFFTPPSVSKLMAGMFSFYKNKIRVLDPGAGVGSLSAAIVSYAILSPRSPKEIYLTAYEIEPDLIKSLEITLQNCRQICNQQNIVFNFEIIREDFINSSIDSIQKEYSLFPVNRPYYDYVILNPPYKKINSLSQTRQKLKLLGIETSNFYSAFVWLSSLLLNPGGELVAIIPRSFCNGTYFKKFRQFLLSSMNIKRIHVFESRNKAFKESDVLQENIIINAVKGKSQHSPVLITSNNNPEDKDIITSSINYDQLIDPKDTDFYFRIIPNHLDHQISSLINGLTCTLKDLGITVSTGRVVDFRAKDFIRNSPENGTIPLIYPNNFKDGLVCWPISKSKKPQYLFLDSTTSNLSVPSNYYVFVKRFSSKEEKRRIYAALYDAEKYPFMQIGIENHINYFHKRYGGLSKELAKGLTVFLNSSIVDQYFRQFSGHTQVNAADLRSLKYPSESQLISLGKNIEGSFSTQEMIDKIIHEEFTLDPNDTNNQDPIRAKKKITEALYLLQLLNVPKAQQNDRSALTLLALANINPSNQWSDARTNLIGITEMMDFFREYYGVNYAPNTRETVRRQTIHQFMQMNMIAANPDNPARPINSPKTRYLIENSFLDLTKSFGSVNWEVNLKQYLKNSPALHNLEVRERIMPMIPVNLPTDEVLYLTSGGQNVLIKKIIEEFCPRFTPGGKVIFIGDAGKKINDNELKYFEKLGIVINIHGKMPDVIVELNDKRWLVLIEAVTSHGPINIKRHNELNDLFGKGDYGLVFLTAFESKRAMTKYISEIAWETEVWVSDAPSHLIHFNGDKFLGPHL